jgi:peroxiredoxin
MPTRIVLFLIPYFLAISMSCHRSGPPDNLVEDHGLQTQLRGVIDGCSEEEIIIEEMGAREYIPIDTAVCKASGSFNISFVADHPAFYVLRFGKSGYITLLMEPGESVELKSSIEQAGKYQVDGSPGSELLLTLNLEHKRTLEALGEITRKNMEYVSSPDYPDMKLEFDRKFDSITDSFKTYSLQYIEANSGSLAILVALYNLYGQGLPVFNPAEDLSVYSFVDSVLMIKYSDFDAVQLLHSQVTESEQLFNENHPIEALEKGKIAPDFVSSRPGGEELALSELRGNYVLLNFWAGWSQLSRDENPALKTAMITYGDQNLKILQVSLDDNRQDWLNAIKDDQLTWDHVSDLKRWNSPAVDFYYVDRIPFTVLIDPNGRIVEVNLFGTELLKELEHIFTL